MATIRTCNFTGERIVEPYDPLGDTADVGYNAWIDCLLPLLGGIDFSPILKSIVGGHYRMAGMSTSLQDSTPYPGYVRRSYLVGFTLDSELVKDKTVEGLQALVPEILGDAISAVHVLEVSGSFVKVAIQIACVLR